MKIPFKKRYLILFLFFSNTMRYSYCEEKLLIAIYRLASGKGDVRSRLSNANQSFHVLRIDDFPPGLQSDWRWVINSLTKKGPMFNYRNEIILGAVDNTLKNMRNKTGAKIAEKIMDIYLELIHINLNSKHSD